MKVLQVINELRTAGAEKLLTELILELSQNKMEVDILLLNGTQHPLLKTLEDSGSCKIHSLGKGSVYNPLLIFKLLPYLKQYSLIHVHLFPSQYWVWIAKLISFSKTNIIFTEHSTTNRRLSYKMLRYINKFVYRTYAKTVCITSEIQTIYTNYTGLPKSKFPVIENGINLKTIDEATPYPISAIDTRFTDEDTILMQVAAFRVEKDHGTLIKAMQYVKKDIKLVLVGEGPTLDENIQLATKLRLHNQVLFLGLRTDVPRLLKTSSIIILSSRHEGLSLSSIEGMAAGKPFIGSDVPGLRNVVKGAGLLFPLGDEHVLAEKINALLTDDNLYKRMALACKQRASNYDISNMTKSYIKLYNEFLITA